MVTSVAFFSNRAMLPGLHAAVGSLCASAERPVEIFVFADGLRAADGLALRRTWEGRAPSGGSLHVRPFRPRRPSRGANRLHGNSLVYGRLYLADLLPEHRRCIYLDADLLVGTDLTGILDALDGTCAIAGFAGAGRRRCFDTALFERAGASLDGPYINTGVLGLDLERWRRHRLLERCAAVSRGLPGCFPAADQSLINLACANEITTLDERYNTFVYPGTRLEGEPAGRVVHFLGSPKPWDPGGSTLHASYELWRAAADSTALPTARPWRYLSPLRVVMTLPSLLRRRRFKALEHGGGPGSVAKDAPAESGARRRPRRR